MALQLKYGKAGTSLKAYCDVCGKLLRYSRGCNVAGLGYARVGAEEDYEVHRRKCRVKENQNENNVDSITDDSSGAASPDRA
jgi:hypothetical protein